MFECASTFCYWNVQHPSILKPYGGSTVLLLAIEHVELYTIPARFIIVVGLCKLLKMDMVKMHDRVEQVLLGVKILLYIHSLIFIVSFAHMLYSRNHVHLYYVHQFLHSMIFKTCICIVSFQINQILPKVSVCVCVCECVCVCVRVCTHKKAWTWKTSQRKISNVKFLHAPYT